jgi:hypothetical protein
MCPQSGHIAVAAANAHCSTSRLNLDRFAPAT